MKHLICLLCLLSAAPAQQQYIISTVAGIGRLPFGGSGGPALSAFLITPQFLATDSAGNTFVSDDYYDQVFKISVSGVITVYAGAGQQGFSGDGGPATAALLNNPQGLATDAVGDLFIVDNRNGRVRKVTPDGTISTAAMTQGGSIAVDAVGNLYVTQSFANLIHMVSPSGVITTIAGTGTAAFSGDGGKATAAALSDPNGLKVDAAGNIYVADSGNNRVRKIDTQGVISTIAGNGKNRFSGDNFAALNATIQSPQDVAIGADGSIYVADAGNGRIRVVNPAGVISTFAGGVSAGAVGTSLLDGAASGAVLGDVSSLALDNKGSLVAALPGLHQVRRVTSPTIMTIAGQPPTVSAGDNIAATSAPLFYPFGIAVDSGGAIYASDSNDNRIRKISTAGIISTFAGNGLGGQSPDLGPAILAGAPNALAFDQTGNLYFSTLDGSQVRRIAPNGTVKTIAGTSVGFSGDGFAAFLAQLSSPLGIAIDPVGNIYIADSKNNRIRKVDASTGNISTIAGTGAAAFGGDNGPATAAALNQPSQLALDSAGNLYVADTFNNRIRKISPAGTISTVAGSGTAMVSSPFLGDTGDGGPATAAQVMAPTGIVVDPAGNLYSCSAYGARIRRVDAVTGIISTIAGTGGAAFSGDGGFATSATINQPEALALDSSGNLYFTDQGNQRVRKLTPAQLQPSGVLNGASLLSGPVSPGEIVAINASGVDLTQGAQVQFDGTSAPVISAQTGQITAIVPYEVAGQTTTQLQIVLAGKATNTAAIPVASTAPGLFTQDSSGQGAGLILNADLSTNSPANPAAQGSFVIVSGTGEGQTSPPGVDGLAASATPPAPIAAVSAQIGGSDAPVMSDGGVPGQSAGYFQAVVQVPKGAPIGDAVPIVLTVGGAASQSGVTISISAGPGAQASQRRLR